MYVLKLYVVGQTNRSKKAVNDLEKVLEPEFKDQYSLEIIDIIKNPQLAEKDKIIATPALIKSLPSPVRRIVGDLNDKEKVLLGLDLIPPVQGS